jgi:hypothetical protein
MLLPRTSTLFSTPKKDATSPSPPDKTLEKKKQRRREAEKTTLTNNASFTDALAAQRSLNDPGLLFAVV